MLETETLSTSPKHFPAKNLVEKPDIEEEQPSGRRGNVM